MLDPHLLRTQLSYVADKLAHRSITLDVATLSTLEARRKHLQITAETLQAARNLHAKLFGAAKQRVKALQDRTEDDSRLKKALEAVDEALQAEEDSRLKKALEAVDEALQAEDEVRLKEALKAVGKALDSTRFKEVLAAVDETLQDRTEDDSRLEEALETISKSLQDMTEDGTRLEKALEVVQKELTHVQSELQTIILSLPNLPDETVPLGKDAHENQEVRRWGEPVSATFPLQDHVALGESLGGIDFSAATKLTGARFVVLKGQIARLHRALIQFMVDLHTIEHSYTEVYVPYLVNHQTLYGTGQLPKFGAELFHTTLLHQKESRYALIPTAEVPLTNLVRDAILTADQLPIKMVAHTPCFRSEAGSHGKDTRGMIRMHQFDKVELVQIVAPETSMQILEVLTSHAERVLQKLELPYRVVLLCTGDLGAGACKTYDLEVWLPSQQSYREVSSCSNMTDFQSRRLQARYRTAAKKNLQWVHTLNGSGLAVERTLIALLENGQQEDGRIKLPQALHPYMGGLSYLG